MAMLSAGWSAALVGTRLSPVHLGQVGQPRPEAVTRTTPPLTMMAELVITPRRASRRRDTGVGRQTASRSLTRGFTELADTRLIVRAARRARDPPPSKPPRAGARHGWPRHRRRSRSRSPPTRASP